MSLPLPIARYLILCDDIYVELGPRPRVHIVGTVTAIAPRTGESYPLLHDELCAYALLAEGRGHGLIRIIIRQADTSLVVFESRNRPIIFDGDPLATVGVRFRIQNLVFPEPGLYEVDLCYNDREVASQPLVLR